MKKLMFERFLSHAFISLRNNDADIMMSSEFQQHDLKMFQPAAIIITCSFDPPTRLPNKRIFTRDTCLLSWVPMSNVIILLLEI